MRTEESLPSMDDEDEDDTRVELNRADSFSSCYSLDSDDCEKRTRKDEERVEAVSELFDTPELLPDPNEIRHPSLTFAFTFKTICSALTKLPERDIKRFKLMLWKRYSQSFSTPAQTIDIVDLVDRMLECYDLEVSLKITKVLLEKMELKRLANYIQTLCLRNEVRYDLCETLKRKYGQTIEDFSSQGAERPLDDIFTSPDITTTCDNGPNIEHEVLTVPKLDSNTQDLKLLSTQDILSFERLQKSSSRFVFVTGVAGSGKSMAMRRLILDWIEERSHQHVSFLFPLPFRELKQFEGQTLSMLDIIHSLYPETKKLSDEDYRSEDSKILLIFDGLDEYTGNLDFQNTELHCDHKDPTTLDVLVVNLLRGRLLYRGLFVITSRPQVKRCIPWDVYYEDLEVRGFCDSAKDEYFRKRFQDSDQAGRVIEYINSLKTLRIMCHLPLFCSLVAAECQRIFTEQGPQATFPRGITHMYSKLLLALIHQRRKFRGQDLSSEQESDFLMNLGKLAFTLLEKGQYKITKSDWKDAEVSDEEAVTTSGLCTQFLIKPFVLYHEKVVSFIHPTMQEYLAALYAFLSFTNHGKNIFEQKRKHKVRDLFKGHGVMELYKSAVDTTLQCEDGKLDFFLRFLFGMVSKTNQELLRPLCTSSAKWPSVVKDAATLIRKTLSERQAPGRMTNLQQCLEELSV